MAIVSRKAVSIQGREYRPGDTVDVRGLSSDKVQQLIAQRAIVDTQRHAPDTCVALRSMELQGRSYARGEFVDVRGLTPEKLSQLLEHRIVDLIPAPPAKAPRKGSEGTVQ